MDALSHCIESFTTWKANVISDTLAVKGTELIGGSLRTAYGQGSKNIESRYNMCVGSMLGINAFLVAGRGLGLAHVMSYPIREVGHVTHGEAVSLALPHVMEYNLPVNLAKFAGIAELMGEELQGLGLRERAHLAVEAVKKLSVDVGMPQKLRDVGLKKEDITSYVDNVFDLHFPLVEANGRNASSQDVTKIFEAAIEYGENGIRVNCIAPGFHTGTNIGKEWHAIWPKEELAAYDEIIAKTAPLGRKGEANELAGLAIYLASDASGYVTGQVFIHDGGLTI